MITQILNKTKGIVLFTLLMLTACAKDEYHNIEPTGDPILSTMIDSKVLMGQQVVLNVNCSDNSGVALSTLKAELVFSGEVVNTTTLRTKSEGNYEVALEVPFLQYIPNGEAIVRLTLQNVSTKTTVQEFPVQVERPHFTDLQFVAADGQVYPMTEGADYTYSTSINVTETAFKGHFETADGQWSFGAKDNVITVGATGNIDFQTEQTGNVQVTFNTRDYTFAPFEEIQVTPLLFSNSENTLTRTMEQGRMYSFSGLVSDNWFVDNDFFQQNGDGTYTFLAIDGTYTLTAYDNYEFLQVYAGTKDEPTTIQTDGTGALWIIGGNGINKPYLHSSNNQGWWTGVEWDQATAQIQSRVYQITLTVGDQLSATDVNFKFFGQPDWGNEFKGDGSSNYNLTCNDNTFGVGDGNGHDNGNIYLKDGATLTPGDTYVFTIDLTNGCANGVLTITKK